MNSQQATDLPRSAAFDHGRLTSRPVSYGILNTFCCVKLRCVTVFDGVDLVLLRMSRYVTVITAHGVLRYKTVYHWDKLFHIGAATIINNRDHALHYAIEGEIKSRTFLINSAVGWLLVFQRTYCYIKGK